MPLSRLSFYNFFVLLAFMVIAGCSNEDGIPQSQLREALSNYVNEEVFGSLKIVNLSIGQTENVGDKVEPLIKSRFEMTVEFTEDLFLVVDRDDQAVIGKLLRETGYQVDIFGVIESKQFQGNWIHEISTEGDFDSIDESLVSPSMIAPLPIILEGTQEAKDHIAARIQRRKEWLIGGWKMEVVGRPSMSGTVIFDAHGNYVGMDKPYAAKPDIFFTKGKWDLRSYDVIEFNRTGTTGKNIKSRLTFESDDQSSFSAKISPLNSKGSVQTFSRPTRVNGKKIKTREETAAENMQASQLFLEQNKSQPGVLTTSTGLQYRVKAEGTGKSPAIDDTVKVHYRGKLISGKEFDSSYSKGKPVSFVVKQVVKGWVEGLQLMREGSNYELFIPPDLGYGKGGAGKVIGPNEALIFEIELLSVE